MLRVQGATVRFGDRAVVDGVDLEIASGETVAILGPSGSGKTTLLRAIAGLQPLANGRITWNGADLTNIAPHQRRFGLMFQEYALFPHRDVKGNVEFGLRMRGDGRTARVTRVDEILELVGLRELRDRRVAGLSGGEQQRVALARALAVEPRLLMLDEPLGALDREWRTRLVDEIRSLLGRAQLSALYVTHDHDEAFAISARVAVMRAGRIVQLATPAEVWRQPATAWLARFLGFAPCVDARIDSDTLITPWGAVPAPAERATGRVQLVVRPDALRIADEGSILGTVTRGVFEGAYTALHVDVENAPPLVVRVPQRCAYETGARVQIAVDPDALLCYPPD